MKIMTTIGYYLPGFKSGGPLRTVGNMVDQFGDEIEFRILTRDRDATDTEPYPEIKVDAWNQVGKAKVYYASPVSLTFGLLRSAINDIDPDALYLNSFFSTLTIQCMLLRKLRKLPAIPMILAPRGEFSPGALTLKLFKKRLYIFLAKMIGLYDGVLWQASSEMEQALIVGIFSNARVHVAPDVPAPVTSDDPIQLDKETGSVRFIFLSRISPKKNLHHLVAMLGSLSGRIHLSIVGPVRDPDYWARCQQAIQALPEYVTVDVLGSIPHEEVHDLLARHHFFVLPTLGENFGHAILEAMAAGTPVLISDQTPWRDLVEKGAGWDIPLDDVDQWRAALQRCVDMPQQDYDRLSESTRAFAVRWSSDNRILEANRRLFEKAVSR